jgi:tetratricopeptide (TPR) repeat protein
LIANAGYLGKWFYPANLSLAYARLPEHLPRTGVFSGLAILVCLTAVALVWRRTRPYLFVGWFWYLTMLVPVIGLVQVGSGAAADRFTYLPQIGLAIAAAWGAAEACRRTGLKWCGCAAAALGLALLAACGWRQVSFWRDSETLWSHAVACEPNNLIACHQLAMALYSSGRDDEAAVQFRIGQKIDSTYIIGERVIMDPVTFVRNRQAKEIAEYREQLRRRPDSIDIRSKLAWRLATSPVQSLRNADEAIRIARRAAELSGGGRPDVLDALAAAYAEAGQFADAADAARKALDLALRQSLPGLAEQIRGRSGLYEDHKPFHEPLLSAQERRR